MLSLSAEWQWGICCKAQRSADFCPELYSIQIDQRVRRKGLATVCKKLSLHVCKISVMSVRFVGTSSRFQLSICILTLAGLFILVLLLLWNPSAAESRISGQLQEPMAHVDPRKAVFPRRPFRPRELEKVFCVVAVTSPAHLPQRRSWQRAQWKKSMTILRAQHPMSTPKYIFKFCLGSHNLGLNHTDKLNQEQRYFDDILFVSSPDFDNKGWSEITVKGQSATTMKVLAALQWAVQTYDFQYIVRLGDDSDFRPENFFARVQLGLLPTCSACIGLKVPAPFKYDTPVGEVSVHYPSGMGFILTSDVAAWIIQAKSKLLFG